VFENLGTSEKKLVIYPEADHESFLNVDPNKWTKEVNDFMKTIPL
jgi:alpha-beta hydrolase superfamily lysophospholipase